MEKTLIGLGLFAVAAAVVFNTVYQPAYAEGASPNAQCELVRAGTAGKLASTALPAALEEAKARQGRVEVISFGTTLMVCSY
jgi:hypothetical protein